MVSSIVDRRSSILLFVLFVLVIQRYVQRRCELAVLRTKFEMVK